MSISPAKQSTRLARSEVDQSLLHRFAVQVAAHRNRSAVLDGSTCLTYGELDERVDRLARVIIAADAPMDIPTAIYLDQGAAFIVAVLAVMRAGRFWTPLDPRIPAARNRYLLNDSESCLLLSNAQHIEDAKALGCGVRVLDVDTCAAGIDGPRVPHAPSPDDLAYVLYTSGSTGGPKGVMHSHRSTLHNVMRHVNRFDLGPEDRVSLLYPCTVYGGIRDIFNALMSGACICRYPLQSDGIGPLASWLITNRITVYCSVATVFRQFVRTLGGESFPDLRLIKLGGEVVYRTDHESYRQHFSDDCLLSCGLATTEVGGVRQFFLDKATPLASSRVSCGYAVEDMEILILDEEQRPQPPGRSGEIAVCSRYLAKGYWRRPELTAEVFLPADDERRVYRTGDLGRIEPDGQLIHLGRRDRQVKIRGNRVEIPEVEVSLLDCPGVEEAAVTAVQNASGETVLAAYVVGNNDDHRPDAAELRNSLVSRLPAFMTPSYFVTLDRLPLLPNGKVDRDALPSPEMTVGRGQSEPPVEPTTDTERQVLELWSNVLDRDDVGTADDFFGLGGDSLKLLELMASADRRFKRHFPLDLILQAPTVAEMARHIDAGLSTATLGETFKATSASGELEVSILPFRTSGSRPPLFFVSPAGGSVLTFYALAHKLGPDQPFYAVSISIHRTLKRPETAIHEMTDLLMPGIDGIRPEGDCLLGGWSFGGFVAYELAQRLTNRGQLVLSLFVVDSDGTLPGRPVTLKSLGIGLWRFFQMVYHSPAFLRDEMYVQLAASMQGDGPANGWRGWWPRLLWRMGVKDAEIAQYLDNDPRFADLADTPLETASNMWEYVSSIRNYDIQPSRLTIALFRPLDERRIGKEPTIGWAKLTGAPIHIHWVSGNHFTILTAPHVDDLAGKMASCLDEATQSRLAAAQS